MHTNNSRNTIKSPSHSLIVKISTFCLSLVMMMGMFLTVSVEARADKTSLMVGDISSNNFVSHVLLADAEVEPEAVETPEAKAAAKLEAKKAKAAAKLEAKKLKEAADAEAAELKAAEKAAKKAAKAEAKKAKEEAKLEAKKVKEAEKAAILEEAESSMAKEVESEAVPTETVEVEPAS